MKLSLGYSPFFVFSFDLSCLALHDMMVIASNDENSLWHANASLAGTKVSFHTRNDYHETKGSLPQIVNRAS
jgi:hypothetical protein